MRKACAYKQVATVIIKKKLLQKSLLDLEQRTLDSNLLKLVGYQSSVNYKSNKIQNSKNDEKATPIQVSSTSNNLIKEIKLDFTKFNEFKIDLSFKYFENNLFEKFSKLKKLKCGKIIETINTETFKGLVNLSQLELNGELNKIERNSFSELKNLNYLKISNSNQVRYDPTEIYVIQNSTINKVSCTSDRNENKKIEILLEKISEDNCNCKLITTDKILNLNSNIFNGLISLHTLIINEQFVISLNSFLFIDLIHLIELDLSKNCIEILEDNSLKGLENLKTLNLSKNKIKSIQNNLLSDTKKLENLLLFENCIESIECGSFSNLNKLILLDLKENLFNFNDFMRSEGLFDRLENLSSISLKNSAHFLLPIDQTLKNFTYLKEVELKGVLKNGEMSSMLISNENLFPKLENLVKLTIACFKIDSISKSSFNFLKKLKILNLSENQILELDNFLFTVESDLQEFYCNNNNLSALRVNVFYGLKNLKTLSLKENRIKKIEENCFLPLESLQSLNLSQNKIESLNEKILNGLNCIKYLDASFNILNSDSEVYFNKLKSLKCINLTGNLF